MGRSAMAEDSQDWVSMEGAVAAKSLIAKADPLSEVIHWLDSTELEDDLYEEVVSPGDYPEDHRYCVDLDTASEGSAMRTNSRPDMGASGTDVVGGSRRFHDDSARAAPSQAQVAYARSISSRKRTSSWAGSCCYAEGVNGFDAVLPLTNKVGFEHEDEEWDARQKQTGAAGRLVIYEPGDRPRDDIVLRGGCGRRVMVNAVSDDGKAYKAGVKPGDVLVSIDGKKDFNMYSADAIQASLVPPVMLVFMGFVGKLQAEVRLNYAEKVAGMSSQQQVVFGRPDAPVQVTDEVVFNPTAPLFLATTVPPWSAASMPNLRAVSDFSGGGGDGLHGDYQMPLREPTTASDLTDDSLPAAYYELRVSEARHVVQRALSRVRARASFEEQYNKSSSKTLDMPPVSHMQQANGASRSYTGSRGSGSNVASPYPSERHIPGTVDAASVGLVVAMSPATGDSKPLAEVFDDDEVFDEAFEGPALGAGLLPPTAAPLPPPSYIAYGDAAQQAGMHQSSATSGTAGVDPLLAPSLVLPTPAMVPAIAAEPGFPFRDRENDM